MYHGSGTVNPFVSQRLFFSHHSSFHFFLPLSLHAPVRPYMICCTSEVYMVYGFETRKFGRGAFSLSPTGRLTPGHLFSLQMAIIFNEEHLCDMQTPCVAQQFVNHSAVLHKVRRGVLCWSLVNFGWLPPVDIALSLCM